MRALKERSLVYKEFYPEKMDEYFLHEEVLEGPVL